VASLPVGSLSLRHHEVLGVLSVCPVGSCVQTVTPVSERVRCCCELLDWLVVFWLNVLVNGRGIIVRVASGGMRRGWVCGGSCLDFFGARRGRVWVVRVSFTVPSIRAGLNNSRVTF
jgi:hypothetical protein